MANLDQIIDYTKIFQDVELASAIGQLKKDPQALSAFINNQQDKVFKNIINQKDNTFQKVYGDLNKATKVQETILLYDKRNKELAKIQEDVYNNQKNSADAVSEDKNMAGRKSEMNEWTVNNKKDTLFVFSSIFIMLSGLLLITVLWRLGMISSYLWVALGTPLVIICILIIVNRSQYTDTLRNKRYWNKKIFEGKYGKIPIPVCPDVVQGIESGLQSAGQLAASGLVNVTQGVAQGANAFAQGANAVAQGVASSTQAAPIK